MSIWLKLNQSLVGNYLSHSRGDEVEWEDEAEAVRLIDAGIARPLNPEAKKAYEAAKAKAPRPAKSEERRAKSPTPPTPPPKDPEPPAGDPRDDDTPVTALDLDETTIQALRDQGLQTVGQVLAHPDLTQLDGVGKATAKKILQAAAAL